MSKEVVVNARGLETRVAILENRRLIEILFERDFSKQIVGNIYKGKVENVLPGMQAAFVDIGGEKNVFLHAKDVLNLAPNDKSRIEDILRPGQEIDVQIVKEGIGNKGPRGTSSLSLAGRYLVLMDDAGHIGISRRIDDGDERGRLRQIAKEILPEGLGVIIRTVAAYKKEEEIKKDLEYLINVWTELLKKSEEERAPELLYRDLDIVRQVLRDKFTPEIDKVIIDQREVYHQASRLIQRISPNLSSRLYYYEHSKPIFDHYNVEEEIKGLLDKKVGLNCGGYIIIDETEALTAIDVNTGSYVGKNNLEETVVKTNLEAVKEIAKQLRLRNIGGIIIIDFIDMMEEKDNNKVLDFLELQLAKDKVKTNILGLTSLGFVEMTRKNERETIGEFLQESCPYCNGKGRILSEESIFLEVSRKIKELFWQGRDEAICLAVHPEIAARLIGSEGKNLARLEQQLSKDIYIKGSDKLHIEDMKVLKLGREEEVKKFAFPVKVGEEISIKVEDKHNNKPQDGIGRVNGYVVDIIDGGYLVGNKVKVEISDVNKTYARARIIENG
ncbi:Rne/Rng family ribonuclease [Halonatronum saccharophilum]|uniref:Rne/Rng family ribonuclease n=1 Tax=Halonatronum saccharophilum TaxID=150060 RepID=UPI00048176B9|nr:Rne/Rng family ribonuclease [Halonatronum saccharophilum]